jgi:hypothetical protein
MTHTIGISTLLNDRNIGIYPKGDFNLNGQFDHGDLALVACRVVGRAAPRIPDADFNNKGVVDIGDVVKTA